MRLIFWDVMHMARTARRFRFGVLGTLLAVAMVLSFTVFAFANQAPTVSGADCQLSQASEEGLAVLSVSGEDGATVYVDVADANGNPVAERLAFQVNSDNAAPQANGRLVGTVGIDVDGGDAAVLVGDTVTAYSDHEAQGTPLFTGKIYGVYAELEGSGASQLVGLRTIGTEQRAFVPQEQADFDGTAGVLKRDAQGQPVSTIKGDSITYTYEKVTAGSDEAKIDFVDESGNVVSSKSVPGIAQGASKAVKLDEALIAQDANGKQSLFRVLDYDGVVTLSNPSFMHAVVNVKQMSSEDIAGSGSCFATVKCVDADNPSTVLMADRIYVQGTFSYTLPEKIYQGEGAQTSVYTLVDSGNPTVTFDASEGETVKQATYKKETVHNNWTVVCYDASNSNGAELARQTLSTADAFDAQNITVDGKTYVPAQGARSYTFAESGSLLYVYYVPQGYTPASYDVTINYVDAVHGGVLQSTTQTVSPDMQADVQFDPEESFEANGITYALVPNQKLPVRIGYGSRASYTVYYYNQAEPLADQTAVVRTRVVYLPGNQTGQNGTQTLTEGQTYNAVSNAATGGATLTNGSGQDTASTQIDENETPTASAADISGQGLPSWVVPLVIGLVIALIAVALIAFAVVRRRKNSKSEEDAK
jgi:hypothetical protein